MCKTLRDSPKCFAAVVTAKGSSPIIDHGCIASNTPKYIEAPHFN